MLAPTIVNSIGMCALGAVEMRPAIRTLELNPPIAIRVVTLPRAKPSTFRMANDSLWDEERLLASYAENLLSVGNFRPLNVPVASCLVRGPRSFIRAFKAQAPTWLPRSFFARYTPPLLTRRRPGRGLRPAAGAQAAHRSLR